MSGIASKLRMHESSEQLRLRLRCLRLGMRRHLSVGVDTEVCSSCGERRQPVVVRQGQQRRGCLHRVCSARVLSVKAGSSGLDHLRMPRAFDADRNWPSIPSSLPSTCFSNWSGES